MLCLVWPQEPAMQIEATKHGGVRVGNTVITVIEAQKMIAVLARETAEAILNTARRQGVNPYA